MKMKDVPDEALRTAATPIPIKMVPTKDWATFYEILLEQGYIIIESGPLRKLVTGGEESPEVKSFNAYVRQTVGKNLQTRRISKTRWICAI
jgi:hypothetical protein